MKSLREVLEARAEKYTEERSAIDYYNASIDNRVYCAYLASAQDLMPLIEGLREALHHWKRDCCCGNAMDGGYLADHLREVNEQALAQFQAQVEKWGAGK